MAAFNMPIRTDGYPHFDFECELDGRSYVFEFIWNERATVWYMTIADSVGTVLLAGIPIVLDYPLISRFASDDLPPGEFQAVDTTGEGTPPTLEDFGSRVQLLYFDESERA